MFSVSTCTLLAFTNTCAVLDLKTHKIPNRLILCGLLCAVLSRSLMILKNGPPALAGGIAGLLLPFLLLGPLAVLKMIGGGDVKLLAVIGLQLGAEESLRVLCLSFVIAALWSFILVIRRHNLFQRFHFLYCYLVRTLADGRPSVYRTSQTDPSGEFCFALPVLAALSVTIFQKHLLLI